MTHKAGGYRFIDPQALAAIKDLHLAARTVVDGLMLGIHRSQRAGAGLEFNQFRSYQPGDDLRRVDWKLYARSDRFFIRESEAETSVAVRIVLDATASMLPVFDYARFLAASLALLAHRQGDAVGLVTLSEGALGVIRPARQQQHFHRLLHQLEGLSAAGSWPDWPRIEAALTADGSRGLVVLLSDLHERGAEIRSAARRLAAGRHDVLVLHLKTRDEVEFPWEGSTVFEESETGRRVELDAGPARAGYLREMEREDRGLRHDLEDHRIGYVSIVTDEPLDHALRRFLGARGRAD